MSYDNLIFATFLNIGPPKGKNLLHKELFLFFKTRSTLEGLYCSEKQTGSHKKVDPLCKNGGKTWTCTHTSYADVIPFIYHKQTLTLVVIIYESH